MHARAEPCGVYRFAVRENDGADYVISMGGRMNPSMLDLIPAFCNVRLRFVDNSTMHSDTCSFQKALVEFGKPYLIQACHVACVTVVLLVIVSVITNVVINVVTIVSKHTSNQAAVFFPPSC